MKRCNWGFVFILSLNISNFSSIDSYAESSVTTPVNLQIRVSIAAYNHSCLDRIEKFYTRAIEENLNIVSTTPLNLIVDVVKSTPLEFQTTATLIHPANQTEYNLGIINWGQCEDDYNYNQTLNSWANSMNNLSANVLNTLFSFINAPSPIQGCPLTDDLSKSNENVESSQKAIIASATTLTAASFDVPSEQQFLTPSSILEFDVPRKLQDQNIETIVIHHRQDPNSPSNQNWKKGDWDNSPGLSSIQIWDGQCWRYWEGSASGNLGSKFAEIGHSMEIENLYEWAKEGHRCIDRTNYSNGPLKAEKIRVVSTGNDTVFFSHLELRTYPTSNPSSQQTQEIFSFGTHFADFNTASGVKYGGGQGFQGLFPDAKVLGPALSYAIPSGRKLTYVEVNCGDSHPDKRSNEDGGTGSKGWGRLSIYIQRKNGSRDYLVRSANVAPQSVISGSPSAEQATMQDGDKVVIEGQSDTVYVMGVRITYE